MRIDFCVGGCVTSKVEALDLLRKQVTTSIGEVLVGIDHKIAKLCVWGVHNHRIEKTAMMAKKQGVELSEDEIYQVAAAYRAVWQIDVSREHRTKCYLCREQLPAAEEQLCRCFRDVIVGVYIEPTLENLQQLQATYPNSWSDMTMEVIECQNPVCQTPEPVKAGVVASKLRKGLTYNPPKYCKVCYRAHVNNNGNTRTSSVPPARANQQQQQQVRTPVIKTPEVLSSVQSQVASASPALAES